MRILVVTPHFPPARGGIQTYCHRSALGLAARGHTVRVLCPSHPAAKAFDAALPFPVERVAGGFWPPELPLAFAFGPAARRFRPDAILYGLWESALWNLLPGNADLREIPQAALVHGRELLTSPFLWWTSFFARHVLAQMAVAFPNSRPVAELLAGVRPDGRTVLAWPGVDAERFAGADSGLVKARLGWQDCLVVGVIARLVPRKGIAALLRAAGRSRAEFPNLRVLVGGRGPERRRLERVAAECGLADACHFAGPIPDEELAHHYAALDVLVQPSLSTPRDIEGFGIVYLEAGSLGVPVLAYSSGGVVDAVADGESGLLVPAGDEEALSAALARLLADPGLRSRLGEGGRRRARALTWERNAGIISDALSSVLPPAAPR